MNEDIRGLLRQTAFFRELSDDELEQLAMMIVHRSYGKREIIFREGDEAGTVYLIHSGLVKTFKTDEAGREQIVSILREGEMFPHTGLFSGRPYPASAETIVPSKLLALPVRPFEYFLEQHAAVALKIMHAMSEKIIELQGRLQEASGLDARDRGLRFLAYLAKQYGEQRGGVIHIRLPLTHQEIASAIGTSRETVSRMLNRLKKAGILESSRSGFVIRDAQALRREIDGDSSAEQRE